MFTWYQFQMFCHVLSHNSIKQWGSEDRLKFYGLPLSWWEGTNGTWIWWYLTFKFHTPFKLQEFRQISLQGSLGLPNFTFFLGTRWVHNSSHKCQLFFVWMSKIYYFFFGVTWPNMAICPSSSFSAKRSLFIDLSGIRHIHSAISAVKFGNAPFVSANVWPYPSQQGNIWEVYIHLLIWL